MPVTAIAPEHRPLIGTPHTNASTSAISDDAGPRRPARGHLWIGASFTLTSLEWEHVIVHTPNPIKLGTWWADALSWTVVWQSSDEYSIRPAPDRLPGLTFVTNHDPKTAKSRLHLDFHPDDQRAEVARLIGLGARRTDVGQGDQPWVVLTDPEGNEFCIL